MRRKIKILVLIKNIDGGTGTYMFQLLNLPQYFPEFDVCTALSLEEPQYTPIDTYNNIICFPHKNLQYEHGNLPGIILLFIKEFYFLRTQCNKLQPDVVISVDTKCNLMACLLKILYFPDLKVIITIHNNISAIFRLKPIIFPPFLIKLIGRIIFQYANASVGVSKGAAQELKKVFALTGVVHTIYCGLDSEKPMTLSRQAILKNEQLLFKSHKINIISICRFNPQKDLLTLFSACSILRQKGASFQLFLLGDGKDRKKIDVQIQNFGIENFVTLLGWKRNIYPYLTRSDIFVLSSFYEGLSYAILEAMSQHLPVISTDTSFGPREILGNGKYGRLVPVGDAEALSTELLQFTTSKKLRQIFAKKSSERILNFSQRRMLDQYRRLIVHVCI